MNKAVIGIFLALLLYIATVGLFLVSLGLAGSPMDTPVNGIFVWAAMLVLMIGAIALFLWSLREIRKGSRAFIVVFLLSGLYLVFILYRLVILVSGFYHPAINLPKKY